MLRKTSVRLGLVLLLLLVIGGTLGYWRYLHIFISTDDAYVSGHVGVISARVNGRVAEVLVDNNQQVTPGQVLLALDPADFQVAVDQAAANLARLRQDLSQRYVRVATLQAKVAQTEANFRLAGLDRTRYAALYERRTVPKQTLDKVNTNYQVTKAEVDQARQELREALAAIGGSTDIPLEEQPALKEARAVLEQARLNLGYTRVKAKFAGFITRRQVQPGNNVKTGQPLMTLVPLDVQELWIEGNFKETQLADVYLGQKAEVTVDAYPGTAFKGRVDSIMAGTGAAFSLLPPENATGNWVKVVQRVPIKVVLLPPFPEDKPLRLGMSAWVSIDTRDHTGVRLLSAGGK